MLIPLTLFVPNHPISISHGPWKVAIYCLITFWCGSVNNIDWRKQLSPFFFGELHYNPKAVETLLNTGQKISLNYNFLFYGTFLITKLFSKLVHSENNILLISKPFITWNWPSKVERPSFNCELSFLASSLSEKSRPKTSASFSLSWQKSKSSFSFNKA